MAHALYKYAATVTDVRDGDSITCDIDLGFGLWYKNTKIRMARINAPELLTTDPAGHASRDELRNLVAANQNRVVLGTSSGAKDKYGRIVAEVYLADGTRVNDYMLQRNLATPYTK